LGVVGGAIAGHKLQDGVSNWKDKRDEAKQNSQSPPPSKGPSLIPHGVSYLGNFSGSSRDMRIDSSGEYTLHASCKRMDGSWQASSIGLNRILSNDHGSFRWAGGEKRQEVAAPRQVTVQAGDTLRGIARQVGCGFEEIARVNGIQNPDLIYPGQVLNVPGGAPACGGGNGGGAGNFGQSARNVRLVDGGRRLEAELLRDGQWVGSSIVLDERIGNDNGTL
ncbi:CVNH domain-containing protein, partial [Immersiella caudata]